MGREHLQRDPIRFEKPPQATEPTWDEGLGPILGGGCEGRDQLRDQALEAEALLDLQLGAAALGEIDHDREAGVLAHPARAQEDRHPRPVAPEVFLLERHAAAGAEHFLHPPLVEMGLFRRRQVVAMQRPRLQLGPRAADEPEIRLIRLDDLSPGVPEDHGHDAGLEHAAETDFALSQRIFRLLRLGDVPDVRNEMEWYTRLVRHH